MDSRTMLRLLLLSGTIGFVESLQRRNQRSIMCVKGTAINGQCVCADHYTGPHCDRLKHCKFNKIQLNGSCVECLNGWEGIGCDQIQCVHGIPDESGQQCICEKPYSGLLCNMLETSDVYSYYNHRIYAFGPIGALSIIPLIMILYGCEQTAQSRRIRRVEEHLCEQNIFVSRRKISTLLTAKKTKSTLSL